MYSQNFIINLFVAGESPDAGGGDLPVPDPGGLNPDGGEEALRQVLHQMFVIVAGLVLLDGVQTILSGVIQVGPHKRTFARRLGNCLLP